jgi:hypothetical protein
MATKTNNTKTTSIDSITPNLAAIRERIPSLEPDKLRRLEAKLKELLPLLPGDPGLTDSQAREVRDVIAVAASRRAALAVASIAESLDRDDREPAAGAEPAPSTRVVVWDPTGGELWAVPTASRAQLLELLAAIGRREDAIGWAPDADDDEHELGQSTGSILEGAAEAAFGDHGEAVVLDAIARGVRPGGGK